MPVFLRSRAQRDTAISSLSIKSSLSRLNILATKSDSNASLVSLGSATDGKESTTKKLLGSRLRQMLIIGGKENTIHESPSTPEHEPVISAPMLTAKELEVYKAKFNLVPLAQAMKDKTIVLRKEDYERQKINLTIEVPADNLRGGKRMSGCRNGVTMPRVITIHVPAADEVHNDA